MDRAQSVATGVIAGSIIAAIMGTHIARNAINGMPIVPGASPIIAASASVLRHASAATMSNAIQPGRASRAVVFTRCTRPRR